MRNISPGDLSPGFDSRAFWLRMELSNPTDEALTRWLSVGHPRLEEISLFQSATPGWNIQKAGLRIPLAEHDETRQSYRVFTITLAAQSRQTIWLRVASRTSIDLSAKLWTPLSYRTFFKRHELSMVLALGGLTIAMIFSGLVFLYTREKAYLLFSMAISGEIIIETFRSGILQSHLWPIDRGVPVITAAIGSLVATGSFFAFIHAFLPQIRQYRIQSLFFYFFYVITAVTQLISIFIAYSPAARFWSISVNILILAGLWLLYTGWRGGIRAAKTLFLSFVFMALLEQIRLASALGYLHFSWGEILVGPWALVMTTPLLLVSVFQRNQDLKEKIIRIESEKSAKTAFLAQMSHELRTPLDTILGNAQLLARPTDQNLLNEGLGNIRQSGKHLLGMIDELLDHARADAGKLVITTGPANWSSFLESVRRNALILAAKNGTDFLLETHGPQPEAILIDSGRLRQILDNLLANAFRHTRSGVIRLDCLVTPRGKTEVDIELAVSDTGEGIAPEDQERIFLPFERVDNAKRSGKGTGMGLAIARQLVLAMGGNLTLHSDVGKGACFRFTLSCELASEVPLLTTQHENRTIAGYGGRRRIILIVDDNQQTRSILRNLFETVGFLVVEDGSGDAAVARYAETGSAIDLVITDQFMESGDGWSLLHRLRTHGAEMPIVLVSSSVPHRPVDFMADLDFSRYLLKPLDHQELLDCLGELLQLEWQVTSTETSERDAAPYLTNLPGPDFFLKLRLFVESGQITEIMELADSLRQNAPQYHLFAEHLYTAARNIDIDALHEITEGQKV